MRLAIIIAALQSLTPKASPFATIVALATVVSANADVLDFGALTRDMWAGLKWFELIATQNRFFISQFGSDGELCGYGTIPAEVRGFWAGADFIHGIPQNSIVFSSWFAGRNQLVMLTV
jgi:hypothetical protein